MRTKRPRVEPVRAPTLFEMEKVEEAVNLASNAKVERAFSVPGMYLGTSSFTAAGWEGTFYPKGMRSADYVAMKFMWRLVLGAPK